MRGSRWRTSAEHHGKTSTEQGFSIHFTWNSGRQEGICLFPFDGSCPWVLDLWSVSKACLLCLLSSSSAFSTQFVFSLSWSDAATLFWEGSQKPFFFFLLLLFCQPAETSKLSSQSGSSEIRQRGISQALGENLIAWMLQNLSFTVFPSKEDWVWVLWCIFWARTSCSPALLLRQANQRWSVSTSARVFYSPRNPQVSR